MLNFSPQTAGEDYFSLLGCFVLRFIYGALTMLHVSLTMLAISFFILFSIIFFFFSALCFMPCLAFPSSTNVLLLARGLGG